MQTYHIWTIGCQMNKADSERLESALGQMGLGPSEAMADADVVVLNSCVVRQSAEDRVTGTLGTLKPLKKASPDKVVALMGCMVGPKTDSLERRFPQVDVFMRPQQFDPLIELLGDRMGIDPEGCIGQLSARPAVTAYVPNHSRLRQVLLLLHNSIQTGQGGQQDRFPILCREIELLADRGVREVTLLGQNVDSYGHDLPGEQDLGDLLEAVNGVGSLERIRFLTSHPNDMSDHIIDAVSGLDKVCEHINLPFQAGGDEVLARMRRGYTNAEYRALVDKVRSRIPNVSMSTDLIVGFCGETEEQFERTLDMVRDIRFDKVHSAAYSTREGTIADRRFEDDVPIQEKKARLRAIDEAQADIQADINRELLGRTGRGAGRGREERPGPWQKPQRQASARR